ncbi:S1 RNA-binding domain-containing protein [Candidatus Poribacteria bacterium]|nr:S1 RNA-binding domain-containing protein [Candidatus Poribacteria bacterium]
MSELEYHIGQVLTGRISSLLPSGVIVKLDENVSGRVPRNELWWSRRREEPHRFLAVGQEVQVKVIDVDKSGKRLTLSMKQARGDPWQEASKNYPVGKVVLGTVTALMNFGAFVELEDGVEGLVHVFQIGPHHGVKPEDVLVVGDSVKAEVIGVDIPQQRIALSIRKYLESLEKNGGKVYKSLRKTESSTIGDQWGDLLREMKNQWDKIEAEEETELAIEQESLLKREARRVLIVDDEEDLCRSLKELLDSEGYDADVAFNGQEAVEKALSDGYDAILLDINMPGMTGSEAMKAILEERSDACILFLSADRWLRGLSESEFQLAAGVIEKPVPSLAFLTKVIEDAIMGKKPGMNIPRQAAAELELTEKFIEPLEKNIPFSDVLHTYLVAVEDATGAEACALFEMEALTGEVTLMARRGIKETRFEDTKYKLQYSPVRDVIVDGEQLLAWNIKSTALKKFQNLLLLCEFDSCIGVPVFIGAEQRHALFLFHSNPRHFTGADLTKADAIAHVIGAAIQREQVERSIERSQRFLVIGQLMSGLAHDIKNRLQVISQYLELLQKDVEAIKNGALKQEQGDNLDRHIRDIIVSKNKATAVADMFLDLARMKRFEQTDVSACVKRVAQVIASEATQTAVNVDLSISDSVPMVYVEGILLEQVLLNVMLNAIHQIAIEGVRGGQVKVEVSYDESNILPIKIRISDNGPGIHRRDFERIFLLSFTTKPEGAGLGLYLCRRCLNPLGGRISVERSVIFDGTTFLIELPA